MTLKLFLVIFFALNLFVPFTAAQTPAEDERIKNAEKLFEEGNELMGNEKFAEALARYKEILSIEPKALGPLYNAGIAAFNLRDYTAAADFWRRFKAEDPEDMQVRAKLIQTYQNLQNISERDAERSEMFKLRSSGNTKGLSNGDFYVREQSEVGGRDVIVFEHFELKTNRAIRYAFYILDDDGEPEFHISLGSYDLTNNIWRETAKPKPKEGERLFHLDGYYQWGHATYGMYPKEPTYDEVRKIVIDILEKDKKPVSSTTVIGKPNEQPEKKEKPLHK